MFLDCSHYSVRYALLESNDIFNLVAPPTPEFIKMKNENNNEFYIKLEESIKNFGVKNPILVTAGIKGSPLTVQKKHKLPENLKNSIDDIVVCDRLGGSRLWIAQKYNLKVPCIISDFIDKFHDEETLISIEQIDDKFFTKPSKIVYDKFGIHIFGMADVKNV